MLRKDSWSPPWVRQGPLGDGLQLWGGSGGWHLRDPDRISWRRGQVLPFLDPQGHRHQG